MEKVIIQASLLRDLKRLVAKILFQEMGWRVSENYIEYPLFTNDEKYGCGLVLLHNSNGFSFKILVLIPPEILKAHDLSVGSGIPLHHHLHISDPFRDKNEIWLVAKGELEVTTPLGSVKYLTGAVVFVPAGAEHELRCGENDKVCIILEMAQQDFGTDIFPDTIVDRNQKVKFDQSGYLPGELTALSSQASTLKITATRSTCRDKATGQ